MSKTAYRVAPPGFEEEQWRTFEEEGIVAYCPAWVASGKEES